MPRTQTDYTQIEYNGRRLKYIVPAAIFVNGYYFLFLYFVRNSNFISRIEPPSDPAAVFPQADATGPFFIQLIIFFVLLVVAFSGLAYFRALGAKGSFVMLASATTLLLGAICVPMYFWGGSHKSIYGALLAAVSALTVIVAETNKIRAIFGVACVIAFTCLSLPGAAHEIVANRGLVGNGYTYTGVGLYTFFQTVAAIASIIIAIGLSWIHAKDKKTIFGDEQGKIHVLRAPASRQQKNDMLQTSIKIAVDVNAGIVSGGGVNYAECVTNLKSNYGKGGEHFEEQHIWCAEWAPATEEIIPESLTPLAKVSNDTADTYVAVNDLAKTILGNKQTQWLRVFRRQRS